MKIIGQKHIKKDSKIKAVKVAGTTISQNIEKKSDAHGIPKTILSAIDPVEFEKTEATPDWEKAKNWEMRLETMQDASKVALKEPKLKAHLKKIENTCTIHEEKCSQDPVEIKVGTCLDNQFRYLLSVAESHPISENENSHLWLQKLSSIDKKACPQMKGIRNDYMMLLGGYLNNRQLKGPFEDLPTEKLQPLTQATAIYIAKRKNDKKDKDTKEIPLNPFSDIVETFMSEMPKIEEGAFAFLSLSGNLLRTR